LKSAWCWKHTAYVANVGRFHPFTGHEGP
jgi:hypothetical protein